MADIDGDGFDSVAVAGGTDCNDNDPHIYPGSPDVRIAGLPPVYYNSIQAAYDNSISDDIISRYTEV